MTVGDIGGPVEQPQCAYAVLLSDRLSQRPRETFRVPFSSIEARRTAQTDHTLVRTSPVCRRLELSFVRQKLQAGEHLNRRCMRDRTVCAVALPDYADVAQI